MQKYLNLEGLYKFLVLAFLIVNLYLQHNYVPRTDFNDFMKSNTVEIESVKAQNLQIQLELVRLEQNKVTADKQDARLDELDKRIRLLEEKISSIQATLRR